ncbi:MAG: hypothetical protein ACI88H_004141 [Cocleimonas sp.]|jgi:hypothetical protein
MDMKNKFRIFYFLFPLVLFLSACGGGSSSGFSEPDMPDTELVRGALVSSVFINNNQPPLFPYSVDSYKITYSTVDTENKPDQCIRFIKYS